MSDHLGEKDFSAADYLAEEWAELQGELTNGSDRTVAVVSVAYIEDALEFALAERLNLRSESPQYKSVFSDRGPLESASSKARMGWALEIFGDQTRSELTAIAEVRNKLAHGLHERSFDAPHISKLCLKLRGNASDPRGRFIKAVERIAVNFGAQTLIGGRLPDLD